MGIRPKPRVALRLVLCLGLIAPGWAPGAVADAAEAPRVQPPTRAALPSDATATFAALASGGGPRHGQAEDDDASASCLPVVQDGFRWVSAAVMANGLPILAYLSRRSYVSGGQPDEDGYLHPRVASYLSETAIAAPIVLEDPTIVGRANGYDNESSVDVAANGIGGLIIVTFIDPVRFRFVVRRSTDLGRTWSQQIADLVEAPEMHMNLGAQMDQICVRFGGVRRLDEVLFHQIEALDRGPHPEPGKLGFRASQVKCP